MESQLHLYVWGIAQMLVELGLDKKEVEAMAVEFDYLSTKLPTKPQQNKDGSISKRKINTTYLTLINTLKEYGLKWKREDVDAFLARNEKVFFDKKKMPRNLKVVRTLLDENLADTEEIIRIVEDPSKVTRTVTLKCEYDCDFLALCMAELYGQNTKTLRLKEYEPRSNSHAGVVDKDEE